MASLIEAKIFFKNNITECYLVPLEENNKNWIFYFINFDYSNLQMLEKLLTHFIKLNDKKIFDDFLLIINKHQIIDSIIAGRGKTKGDVPNTVSENKRKNEVLQDVLPDYGTLVDYTERLFDTGDYEAFVVNFLLLNYNTRNLDLDFDIVTKLDDALDPNTNYVVIMPKYNLFIRNRYKTASFYGSKSHKIIDDKFMFAIKKIYQTLKKRNDPDYINPIIPNKKTIGYRIQSFTYKKLGEGNYVKICINHFRDDLDELKRISENRGTSISMIISDYDIENVEETLEIKE